MRKIELIRRLLDFVDTLNDDVVIRLVERNEDGVVIADQTCSIDSVGSFLNGSTINITSSNISEKKSVR
jgi:hypothetical protein